MRHRPFEPAALCAGALFVLILPFSAAASRGAEEGLTVALSTAIPSLFPFLVLSGLLVRTGAAHKLGRLFAPVFQRLYGLPGEAAGPLLMGLTGGYPVGAQTARTLFDNKTLSREQAEHLLGFCNNTGPAFLVGVCGAELCGSAHTGIVLYGIHIVSALLTGLSMSGRPCKDSPARSTVHTEPLPFSTCLVDAVEQAGRACLKITAFIMLFSMLRRVLEAVGGFSLLTPLCAPLLWFLGAPPDAAEPLLVGLLEMTSGLILLPDSAGRALLPAMSFLTSFGGLSVLCQTAAVIHGLSMRRVLYGKLIHGCIAAGLTIILQAVLPLSVPVFAPSLTAWRGHPALGVIFCLCSIFCVTFSGKRRHNQL